MYSTHNWGKSVVAERVYRTLKNKIYKCLNSISKNGYINKLDDIVNKYNNTYHNIIKIKPVDVKSNTYIDSSKEVNDEDHKFKIDDSVRISKYKNVFAKGYVPNWSEEVYVITKTKNTVPWTYVTSILKANKLLKKYCKKQIKKGFRVEKVIKRKDDKLYVKWKGYDSSFNSWIDKKDSLNEWIFFRTKVFWRKSKSWIRFI